MLAIYRFSSGQVKHNFLFDRPLKRSKLKKQEFADQLGAGK